MKKQWNKYNLVEDIDSCVERNNTDVRNRVADASNNSK